MRFCTLHAADLGRKRNSRLTNQNSMVRIWGMSHLVLRAKSVVNGQRDALNPDAMIGFKDVSGADLGRKWTKQRKKTQNSKHNPDAMIGFKDVSGPDLG